MSLMPRRSLLVAVSAVVLALASACTKSESGSTGPASSTAPPTASTAPAASANSVPTTAPAESATTAAKDATNPGDAGAEPKKAAPANTSSAAASASASAPECGKKPLPDCPLQAWMKANANPPVMTKDAAGLATALDKIVLFAPPGYTNWASIAKDGATAARSGDVDAAKAACRTCHDQYKQKYKTELRARKL